MLHNHDLNIDQDIVITIVAIVEQAYFESTYLEVFDVWEGNSNGDHGPGIVISEV